MYLVKRNRSSKLFPSFTKYAMRFGLRPPGLPPLFYRGENLVDLSQIGGGERAAGQFRKPGAERFRPFRRHQGADLNRFPVRDLFRQAFKSMQMRLNPLEQRIGTGDFQDAQ